MKNKEINFDDLFRPNRYNINPDVLKVNDVIVTNGLGLMELTEKLDDPTDHGMHGKKLFSMKKLFGTDDSSWTLYSSAFTDKLDYVKMATDDDIVQEMINISCDYQLGKTLHLILSNYSKEGGVSIYHSGREDFVSLSETEARMLRDALNNFLD